MAGHTKIVNPKTRKRLRRKRHIRKRISGTAARPRLVVFRSSKHIYAQAVDDDANTVLASISDRDAAIKAEGEGKKKGERANIVGKSIGAKLKELNITTVVFDRNGFIYHGRVKQVAEGAREAGLEF
jgi:large subunit ribosomal protein L18